MYKQCFLDWWLDGDLRRLVTSPSRARRSRSGHRRATADTSFSKIAAYVWGASARVASFNKGSFDHTFKMRLHRSPVIDGLCRSGSAEPDSRLLWYRVTSAIRVARPALNASNGQLERLAEGMKAGGTFWDEDAIVRSCSSRLVYDPTRRSLTRPRIGGWGIDRNPAVRRLFRTLPNQ